MAQLLVGLLLLLAVPARAELWQTSAGARCRAAHHLLSNSSSAYADDVTLWCRHPLDGRRSVHVTFYLDPDGHLTTAVPGGLPSQSTACRSGLHVPRAVPTTDRTYRRLRRRFWQAGCCPFVLTDATAAGDLVRGTAVVVSFTGFARCPRRDVPSVTYSYTPE